MGRLLAVCRAERASNYMDSCEKEEERRRGVIAHNVYNSWRGVIAHIPPRGMCLACRGLLRSLDGKEAAGT